MLPRARQHQQRKALLDHRIASLRLPRGKPLPLSSSTLNRWAERCSIYQFTSDGNRPRAFRRPEATSTCCRISGERSYRDASDGERNSPFADASLIPVSGKHARTFLLTPPSASASRGRSLPSCQLRQRLSPPLPRCPQQHRSSLAERPWLPSPSLPGSCCRSLCSSERAGRARVNHGLLLILLHLPSWLRCRRARLSTC